MKKGDTVRVLGNAVGTAWEIGMIMDINKDGAIIGYGARYIDDPWALYGCQPVQRIPLNKLELITVSPDPQGQAGGRQNVY